LDLLSRACGANLVPDAGRATKGDLGAFIRTREELRGGINHWILDAEDSGATLIARGSTNGVLDEVERCFADGLGVACQLMEEPLLLPGGGATQVALGRRLRRHAESVPGREQMAIEAWADALESIPRALAENAGFDGIDSLLKLTAAQNVEGDFMGLNLGTGDPSDTVSRGLLEPLKITRQAISGATEASISILRIDDVLWAQMDAQVPDEVQEQLQGLGAE
jgi:chaperonin GroEL (HSP60 family)